ncbi:major facilitator superfamily domain-containing protein, partial [Thamnocephalis sphaerospora]
MFTIDLSAAKSPADSALKHAGEEFLQSFPEGGYGWLVVLSAFLVNFVLLGYAFTWGIYQALYLTDVYKGQITTFQLTFVGGLTTAVLFVPGPFLGVLNQLLGFRLLMCAGAILQPLGLLLASWAHSPWQLYLTHGVLVGIGSGLIFFPSVFLPSQWFLKRRGLATGISVAGSGIGGLVFGPLTRALIDAVGFRWCLRYVAIGSFIILAISVLLARECEATKRPLDTMSVVSQTKQHTIDLSLLKSADFAALAMMATLVTLGFLAPLYLLPSYTTFIGLTASDGALFVGLSSGISAIGRISLGFAADRLGVVNMLFVCAFFPGMTILL